MLVGTTLLRPSARRLQQVQLGDPLRAPGRERSGPTTRSTSSRSASSSRSSRALPWLTVFTPYRNGYVPTLTFGHEPIIAAAGPLSHGRRHLLRGHGPARGPPVLPRDRRRPPAGHADQHVQRRLVPRLGRARHAPGRERLPHDRAPRPPGPRREHGDLGPDRRQRRDPRHASPPDRVASSR